MRFIHSTMHVQVIESYSYFSLSVAMTLYLTDEFGISDLAVRTSRASPRCQPLPASWYMSACASSGWGCSGQAIHNVSPHRKGRCAHSLDLPHLRPRRCTDRRLLCAQAGTYYGLWGMLATVYGFVFGGLVDWLGKLQMPYRTTCSGCSI